MGTDVPTSVAIVRDFVNTEDHELHTDELETTRGLTDWLVKVGLTTDDAVASDAELALAHRLRAGLRRGLELNHDQRVEPLPELDRVLSDLPVRLTWDGGAPVLSTDAPGVLGGLARVALAAHESVRSRDWERLKICAFDECAWAYFDHSKNRSRAYCEYGCGNKVKTRAYRARRRVAVT
ncbi:MAG TPA: CGNR zinc finger domain-containing protein [Nocardioides sp.]|jgi:predicted RNA-binding Zn ribbon-like protein|nr:CGNR zinc finger domain-containing protein [Nocardioides sp.]